MAPMPSPGDEAMLYQMIVGAWPADAADLRDYTERLADWQLKALREAKLATDGSRRIWTTRTRPDRSSIRSWQMTGSSPKLPRSRGASGRLAR